MVILKTYHLLLQRSQKAGREYTNIKYSGSETGGPDMQMQLSKGGGVVPAGPWPSKKGAPPK